MVCLIFQERDKNDDGLVIQETKPIKTEILLLWILLADLVNGIVTEALLMQDRKITGLTNTKLCIEKMEQKFNKQWSKWYKQCHLVSIWIGFVFPLLVYLVAGIQFIAYDYLYICCKCRPHKIKSKCMPPKGLEWVRLPAMICTIFGSMLYFTGDNLHKIYDGEQAHVRSFIFLVLGLLFYRVVPFGLKLLLRYCKYKPNKSKGRIFNLWSPNDNETDSLIVAFTYLLTIVIDFDILLTVAINEADHDATNSIICNSTDITVLKILQGSMITFFAIIGGVIAIIFVSIVCRCPHPKNDWFKLILPTRTKSARKCYIALDILLSIVVPIAVAFFLIADNQHLLGCYGIKFEIEATLRVVFLSIAFTVFTVVTVGFFCRKICCFVQVKSKIISVNVVPDCNQLEIFVRFKGKEEPCILVYNTLTSEIMSCYNCNHYYNHELCKKDIEYIVKQLGWIGKLMKVNVQEDQIVEVREIEEKLYVVVHNTSEPAKSKAYSVKEQEEDRPLCAENTSHDFDSESHGERQPILREKYNKLVPLQDLRLGKLLIMYNQDNYLCSIYLKEDEEYAVLVKKPKEDADYKSLNIIHGQVALRVWKDGSGVSHNTYNPKEGRFRDDMANEHDKILQQEV